MKIHIVIFFVLLLCVSCGHNPQSKEWIIQPRNLDSSHGFNLVLLSSHFLNDTVSVFIDSTNFFQGICSTDPRDEIAAVIPYLRRGNKYHKVHIEIKHGRQILSKEILEDSTNVSTIVNNGDSVILIESSHRMPSFR